MATNIPPPRAQWYDNIVLRLSAVAFFLPYALTVGLIGFFEVMLNIYQQFKQPEQGSIATYRLSKWTQYHQQHQNLARPKTAIVTGGSIGLGYETSKSLVEAGFLVLIACRDLNKGQEAVARIEYETGVEGKAVVLPLDLASLKSVREFVKAFEARGYPALDVLVNNAGVMDLPAFHTKDGFEGQFGINHLGHYLLTMLLLPSLDRASQGRIVVLSSGAHYGADKIRYDTLTSKTFKGYSRLGHYAASKAANTMFVKALDRRIREFNKSKSYSTRITVNAVHPGACLTELFRYNRVMYLAMQHTAFLIPYRTPQLGAMTTLYLALAPELESVSGEYFLDQQPRVASRLAENKKAQEELWSKSVEWTGADFKL